MANTNWIAAAFTLILLVEWAGTMKDSRALSPWSIGGLAILAGAIIVAAAAFELWTARNRLEASTLAEATNLANVGDAQVRAQLRLAIDAMRGLGTRAWNGDTYAGDAAIADSASLLLNAHPGVESMQLVDPAGAVIYASGARGGIVVPARRFVPLMRITEPGRRVVEIGRMMRDARTGRWYIPLRNFYWSRDGRQLGAVLAAIRPAALVEMFEGLARERYSSVSLAQRDGTIIARYPDPERFTGRSLARGEVFQKYLPVSESGATRITGVLLGRDLYIAYRGIAGTPFVINISFDVAQSLEPWYRRVWLDSLIVLLALVLVGTTALLVARGQARRLEAAAARQAHDIIGGMPSFAMLVDGEGTLVEANPALLELAATTVDRVIGVKAWDAPWFGRTEEMRDRIRSLLRSAAGTDAIRVDLLFLAGDGRFVAVDTTFRSISGGRVVVSGVDVTERRDLEARLSSARKLEAIGLVTSEIAHDFANYISAIVGFADFLTDDLKAGSTERSYAERIVRVCTNARQMISQILSFGRPEVAAHDPIELNAVLTEVETTVRPLMPASVSFDFDLTPRAVFVAASGAQLSQIFVNLCTNARDALSDKAGSVALAASVLEPGAAGHPASLDAAGDDGMSVRHVGSADPAETYVRIVVTDTGEGISQDALTRIFEPFYTTKPRSRGTGLGLAIVHGIVPSLKGAYRIESVLGQGTQFAIYLPVARVSRNAVAMAA